jgi:hypothetical protein
MYRKKSQRQISKNSTSQKIDNSENQGVENKSQTKTETLSSLLKKFETSSPDLDHTLGEGLDWVTQSRLKANWPKVQIKIPVSKTSGDGLNKTKYKNEEIGNNNENTALNYLSKDVETIALSSADYLEKILKELEEKSVKINNEKNDAKEFARNCFVYLNNVHENTCLGEAGKIMLQLFDQGDLSGDVILGLIERAEELSFEKKLPFANKLTAAQSNAINFMIEERDLRITPTIEDLQSFLFLHSSVLRYTPLLKALTCENFKEAQEIVIKIS